jgi:hypothetical protein
MPKSAAKFPTGCRRLAAPSDAGQWYTDPVELVRDHLADLVAREGRRRAAAKRLKRAMQEELVEVGPRSTWTREDLYGR